MIILEDSCPVCKSKNIEVNLTEYTFPDFGKVLIYSFVCKDCLFKTNEIFPLDEYEPVKYKLKIKNQDDLKKKIIKSPYTKFYIEEISLEILPGSAGTFYIYPIDGFIQDIIGILNIMDKEKVKDKIEYLKEVLEGKKELTIDIEDEKGLTKIV